jgi:hypothetical protein
MDGAASMDAAFPFWADETEITRISILEPSMRLQVLPEGRNASG